VSVCVCIMEVKYLGDSEAQPLNLPHFVLCVGNHKRTQSGSSSLRRHNQGAAAEGDTIREE